MNAQSEQARVWIRRLGPGALLIGTLLAPPVVAVGCRPVVRMCVPAASECGDGVCVAGRCVPRETPASPSASASPLAAAVVLERWTSPLLAHRQALPTETLFRVGGSDGDSTVLLAFQAPPSETDIVEAFLLLPVAENSPPATGLLALRADAPVEPWRGLEHSRPMPELRGEPGPATVGAPNAGALVRVDVTAQLKQFGRARDSVAADAAFEVALLAESSGRAVWIRPFARGGGVRLDVYYRQPRAPSAEGRPASSSGSAANIPAPSASNGASRPFPSY